MAQNCTHVDGQRETNFWYREPVIGPLPGAIT